MNFSIMPLIGWLSTEGNALLLAQVFVALVTALATIALWRVTKILAIETARLAERTARPFIVCSLESSLIDPSAMNLVVRNTGNATGFDINILITPALPEPDGTAEEEAIQSQHKVSFLPPNQVLKLRGVMSRDIPEKTFDLRICWSAEPDGKVEELKYSMEARDGFRGGWNEKSIHHIAIELEKIRKELSNQKPSKRNSVPQ